MCYIDGQKNKYSVLNECNRMLKYNIFNIFSVLCSLFYGNNLHVNQPLKGHGKRKIKGKATIGLIKRHATNTYGKMEVWLHSS
jgi:hypothetical protein